MVEMDRVVERVLRGVYVGVGAVGAEFTDSVIRNRLTQQDVAVAGGTIVTGSVLSVGSDLVSDTLGMRRDGFVNDFVEYAGYGVSGAGWANLMEAFELTGTQTASSVINVSSHASEMARPTRPAQPRHTTNNQSTRSNEVLLDSA